MANKKKGKSLLESKTFWFNLLAVIVAVATLFGFGEFKPDVKVAEGITLLAGIVNVLLRLRTAQPITRI